VTALARSPWTLPAAIVVLDVLVQLRIRPYPKWNDALMVMDFARRFPHMPDHWRFEPVPVAQHALRIGLILPARGFQMTFGYGQVAYYAFPFLAGLVLVLATYWLGLLLFGRAAGAFAALIIVLQPLLVRTTINNTSWQLLPDIPGAALFTLGLALLLWGAQRRRSAWWLAAAGFCFGWAYLAREFVAFMFPVIVVALMLWRVPWRRWWAMGAPMLGLLALEMVLAWRMHGDALARLHVGAQVTDPPKPHYTRVDVLTGFWHMLEKNPGAVLMLALMAMTVLLGVVVRRRELVLCAVWCALLWAALLLFAGLIDPHHVTLRDTSPRYWVSLLPPVALATAGALALLRGRRPAAPRTLAAATAAAALLAFYAVHDVRYMQRFDLARDEAGLTDARWSALRAFLHHHDRQLPAIASDGHTLSALDVIYRYAPLGGAVQWHGAAIVANHARGWHPQPRDVDGAALLWSKLTSAQPRLRDGWRLAWASDNGALRLYEPA
jgi:Dolichyl-phosphate-mannose-protein mannosyltransferase